MRPPAMNARPLTGQSTAQPLPGMTMPQNTMPGRPQQPQAPNMQQPARPGYQPPRAPQVEEAVAVLQAHQAKEAAFQSGAPRMRSTRPAGPTGGVAATGQPQMRPSAMNARPNTGQSTAQPLPGMTMPQKTMPGRPQQPQAPNMQQSARLGYQPSRAPQQGTGQSIVVPGQDALTASMLAAVPPQEQKEMLGERLFPLIQRMHPELAGRITGMLLEIDNSELLHMLESHESLKAKVEEAVAVLQAHQAKEAAFQSGTPRMRPTHPAGPTGGVAATGQPQMRPSAMNARPNTGQSTAQPLPGMTMPQKTMPGRPQQPQAPNMQQSARLGYQRSRAPQQGTGQSIVVPGQDALTASMLAAVPPQEQKEMLGERLFPLIQRMHPELAGRITGMLLDIDNSELLHMLESHESLKAKVEEAVALLQAHQAKEAAFQSGTPRMRPTRPAGPTGGVAATGQPQMRPSAMNARPNTGQSTAQPLPGMTMPQKTMPGRPQQPQAPNMQQSARLGYQPSRAPQQGAGHSIVVPGQDALTASMLAAAPPQEQKHMLGERLFPLVQRMHPELAGRITGILLEIDNSELLHMLESHESLKAMVEKCVAVLQAHQAKKEAAANYAATNAKKKDM